MGIITHQEHKQAFKLPVQVRKQAVMDKTIKPKERVITSNRAQKRPPIKQTKRLVMDLSGSAIAANTKLCSVSAPRSAVKTAKLTW
jgi:hypothetical protein